MSPVCAKRGSALLWGFLASTLGVLWGTESPDILKHPVSQHTLAGNRVRFEVGANSPPLQYQWFKDGHPIDGAGEDYLDLPDIAYSDVGNYHAEVSNAFGTYTSDVATLTLSDPSFAPGTFDTEYRPDENLGKPASILPLPDGSALIGSKDGILTRLEASGAISTTFNQGRDRPNDRVRTMFLLDDGLVLLAGDFTIYNGVACHHLCKVDQDGKLSDDFENRLGVNDGIRSLEVLPSGKILIAGAFTKVNGAFVRFLARLMPDGTVDQDFELDSTIDRTIAAMAVTAEGQILVAGFFSKRFVRLHANGTLDSTFPDAELNAPVTSIRVQSTGHLVPGDTFNTVHGVARSRLARLLSNGQVDLGFPNHRPDSAPKSVTLDSEDRILATGEFRRFGDTSHPGVVRLLADGEIDRSFQSLPLAEVETAALDTNGDWLVGGDFKRPRRYLLRLRGDLPTEGLPPRTLAPITQHRNQERCCLALSVNARAYPPAEHVWKFDGTPLPNQKSSPLHLAPFRTQDNGLYQGTAKNAFGESETLSFPATVKDISPFAPHSAEYSRGNPVEEIPNKIGQVLESTIIVNDDFVVDRMTVAITITHTAVDQLTAELYVPGNPVPVLLFDGPSKNRAGRDFDHTRFDDAAPELLRDGIAPFLGTYSVEEGSLRQLVGRPASGEWRLRITDGVQTFGIGQLENWSIKLLPKPPPVRFETWSLLTGETDTLVYALTEPTAFLTGKDQFGNVTLSHRRWSRPEDILYRYEVSNDLLDWRPPQNLRVLRQRSSDPVEDVHITWQPISQQQFLRLRSVLVNPRTRLFHRELAFLGQFELDLHGELWIIYLLLIEFCKLSMNGSQSIA
jgi:uncharacterized delta-60 repeat protein